MKIVSKVWTKKNGWQTTKTIYYGLLSFKLQFSFCFGIGYFTAYEDDEILVKTFFIPFFRMTEIYTKINRTDKK